MFGIPTISNSSAQAMIAFNKQQIKDLETEKKYLQHMINTQFWPKCNPLNKEMRSAWAFLHLNQSKDEIKVIRKKIKLLAEMQRFLKFLTRN